MNDGQDAVPPGLPPPAPRPWSLRLHPPHPGRQVSPQTLSPAHDGILMEQHERFTEMYI